MRRAAGILVAVAVLVSALPVLGYLKLGSRASTGTVNLKWDDFPIRYFVTNRGVPGVTAQQLQAAVVRAFNTWNGVDTAQTSSQFAGFTQAPPFDDDDMTVLGFLDRPELDRVLGATTFLIDVRTGEIVESDIFFNATFPWSTSSAGQAGSFDLESIALHEIGHLHGLGHSALGETEMRTGGRRVLGAEAVMFPIAFAAGNVADRTLKADDLAGISDIYPTAAFQRDTGSISGRVTKNGTGVLGAHVVAFNPRTGKLVGGFTLSPDGSFVIAGLDPGPHVLRAEPLDDGDLESFFDATFSVDLNFSAKFHDKLAIVPRGGGTRDIEIKVSPK
ncbi:MAG: matrixin family metalloprotease [Acidobacteria bacterium]|nr:matrixin family metalloprotease [Acidobacteriota bacterium]MCA1649058.1 matrixin family metalloprotease [Acidobacteriota bacterium]